MHTGNVTTPFGRRPMTYGMVADQLAGLDLDEDACVDKWKLYRWLCEARSRLAVSDRALSLLNALLSFYPKSELAAGDSLIVFPSNAQLSLRAHGMAEATIRRHLAALVAAGLLVRRDSANGKRFARRNGEGAFGEAFGFSLALLLARAKEFEAIAAAVVAERIELQCLKEQLTICRRDVVKLLDVASDEDDSDDWLAMRERYATTIGRLPRHAGAEAIKKTLQELAALRNDVITAMEKLMNSANIGGNPNHNERHKQNSNTKLQNEIEPSFETKLGEPSAVDKQSGYNDRRPVSSDQHDGDREGHTPVSYQRKSLDSVSSEAGIKPFPLGMVLSACPEIQNYGPNSLIGSWRDLMAAAVVVRSMLGVSPSAYEEACAVMGPENAATVIACILERAGHINSAGGYLRDLTRRAERGEFSLGPVLMAQMRANGHDVVRRA